MMVVTSENDIDYKYFNSTSCFIYSVAEKGLFYPPLEGLGEDIY